MTDDMDTAQIRKFFYLAEDMIGIAGFDGYFKMLNPAWERTLGYSEDDLLERPFVDFIHPDDVKATQAKVSRLGDGASSVTFENRYRTHDGNYRWLAWSGRPSHEDELIYFTVRDITEKQEREAERHRLQEEIIETQRRTIDEISAPIIPLYDEIILLPLLGNLDSDRAGGITRSLLAGISAHLASTVIIDLTGLRAIDGEAANHLNHAIQAAHLKGCTAILTGINDAVAETLVDLGVDWSSIETQRDLSSALESALAGYGMEICEDA